MKVISILSQKGGSGKTTLALHLAVQAHLEGKTVIVADLDPQASASMWHQARSDDFPHVQPTHPASINDLVKNAKAQGVDYLIFDTAPQTDSPAIAVAEVSDLILMTCKPTVMDLRAMQNTLRIRDVARLQSHCEAYIVFTQVEPVGSLIDEARDTLKQLNAQVLPMGMGRRVAYSHCLIGGQTAQEYEPSGKASKEIKALFKMICDLDCMSSSNLDDKLAMETDHHVETASA